MIYFLKQLRFIALQQRGATKYFQQNKIYIINFKYNNYNIKLPRPYIDNLNKKYILYCV